MNLADPELFQSIRQDYETNPQSLVDRTPMVAGRPYRPDLVVDLKAPVVERDEKLVGVVRSLLGTTTTTVPDSTNTTTVSEMERSRDHKAKLEVSVVTGGITNALFCISGLQKTIVDTRSHPLLGNDDSVLVRVFGGEGLIDRDIETCTYSALSMEGIAPKYYGRFQNGRMEGFLNHYRPLQVKELSENETLSTHIAIQLSKLHNQFKIPSDSPLYKYHRQPGMWDQLFAWMEQAKKNYFDPQNKEQHLEPLVSTYPIIDLMVLEKELHYLKEQVVPKDAKITFCHNDLLAANIMTQEENTNENNEEIIKLIDFEYGGCNYLAFDIANHFNEYAGGTDNGIPNYDQFPTHEQQRKFIVSYLQQTCTIVQQQQQQQPNDTTESLLSEESISNFLKEIQSFVLVNHLYWGLWAVNQAYSEGCEDFNYLLYASNRFTRYYHDKNKL